MSDSEIGLSSGKGPTVIVRSDAKSGQRDIVGDVGPFEIEALRLTRLPDAPAGSAVEKEAIQQITQKAQETRRERKQEITLGAGAQSGAKLDPVFSASWRMSINPSVKTAGSVQIPLRIDIDYAPNSSVLVGVSAGGEVAIPTKLPVNVRIVGGIAGGALEGTTPGGGKTPLLPVIGPTIGAGIGIGSKTFRMEFDYQRLQNLAHSSPNVDTFIVSGGVKF